MGWDLPHQAEWNGREEIKGGARGSGEVVSGQVWLM